VGSVFEIEGAAVREVDEEGPGVELGGGERVWVCEIVEPDAGLKQAVLQDWVRRVDCLEVVGYAVLVLVGGDAAVRFTKGLVC
jgi:hypothetical protein